jgi:hypothetical protein
MSYVEAEPSTYWTKQGRFPGRMHSKKLKEMNFCHPMWPQTTIQNRNHKKALEVNGLLGSKDAGNLS